MRRDVQPARRARFAGEARRPGSRGGLAGGKPVGQPERFRCAFAREQGEPAGEQ